MSITDISAGRLAQAPAPTFGARRVRPIPRPPSLVSQARQAARQALSRMLARSQALWQQRRAPAFWRQGMQLLPRLPVVFLQGVKSLGRVPGLGVQSLQSLAAALKPSQVWSREAAVRALVHSNASRTFSRLSVYLGALVGLALVVTYLVRSNPGFFEAGPSAPPAAEWVNVTKPYPAFSMPMPELVDGDYAYALRRHAAGGRQDIMRWGALQSAAPHLMAEIYRPGAEHPRFESAALEISARLEGLDAAMVKPAGEMETKFGPVSLVAFSLKPARQCLGFVRSHDNPRLQILGWHCVSGAAPERDFAACALDRLTLLAAGSEPKVRELFARAELKRNFCGQPSPLMAPTPRLGPIAPRGRVAGH